jgi:prepilin peptidase CpaA
MGGSNQAVFNLESQKSLKSMDIFFVVLLASAITFSVLEDLRRSKIPNLVTYPTMVLALSYHSLSGGLNGFLFSAGGLFLGIGLFIIPYLLGGMGAGDAKLMGAAGAALGPEGILIASIMVILAGGVYGVILFALNPKYTVSFVRRWWLTLKTFVVTFKFLPVPPGVGEKLPVLRYAVPIALGTIGYMLMKITGYDLFPELLGDKFEIFSIAMH